MLAVAWLSDALREGPRLRSLGCPRAGGGAMPSCPWDAEDPDGGRAERLGGGGGCCDDAPCKETQATISGADAGADNQW